MADVKISALPSSTTPLAGTEVLPIVQSSTTKKVTVADLTAGRTVNADTLNATNVEVTNVKANDGTAAITISDTSGNVGIGTTNAPSNKDTITPRFIVNGSGVAGSMQVVRNTTPGGGGGILELTATRGTDVNSYTVLQNGDGVGSVVFGGADGNEFVVAALIQAQVDDDPGDNDMPGRLIFYTTADGASSPTERMRIDSSGKITDQYGNIRAIPQSGSAKTGSYTLAVTDVGQFIEVGSGGSITVPDATFSAGDVVSIFNNTSGTVTLTMSITTAYIGGADVDEATIDLATRGVATILFISGTVCVVNGNVS